MNLHGVDLNLLLAFNVLMEEKSVTRAARRLYVSQSAMSHTLRRLRELLNDRVLVATRTGMRPTPRAQELIGPVREALILLDRTIAPAATMQPETSDICFTLGSTDYVEYVVLPPLLKMLAIVAPKIRIHLKKFDAEDVESCLEEREIDLVIRMRQALPIRLKSAEFSTERPVVLVRKDHPLIDTEMTVEQYAMLHHVVIDSLEADSRVDKTCKSNGISRMVAVRSPNFLSAPIILAESDLVATLPLRIARLFTRGGRLKIVSCPLSFEEQKLEMVWHTLIDRETAHTWFRQQLLQVASDLGDKTVLELV